MWENVTFRVTYCHVIYNHLLVDLHTANIPPSETCLDMFGKLFELLLFASVSHERGCSHYIPESTCLPDQNVCDKNSFYKRKQKPPAYCDFIFSCLLIYKKSQHLIRHKSYTRFPS